MNPETFAEWLRRQGRRIFRTASSYWHGQGPRVYQAFPYHWVIEPSEEELVEFLRRQGAIGLRYSTPLGAPFGCLSYHGVYEAADYGFDNLSASARSNVRRGLKHCSVERIPLERLAEEGWLLQSDTLQRQGRTGSVKREAWRQLCRAAVGLPGFEAWGALVDNHLAGSILVFQMDDCCYLLYPQSRTRYLRLHVNNALSFSLTQQLIGRPGVRSVFYGLHSLDAPGGVDDFKFRLGYTAKPLRQRVVFHPWLSPLMNRASHRFLKTLARLRPGSPTLAKAEGMMHFYLEGLRPAPDQALPDVLQNHLETHS